MLTVVRLTIALSAAVLLVGCTAPSSPLANTPQANPTDAQPGTAPITGAQSSSPARQGGPLAQIPGGQAVPTLNPAATPQVARGEITRTELYEEVVEIEGARYQMFTVEITFGPRAVTPVHVHPGPSTGYVENGRITVSLAGGDRTVTYSAGSAITHPWNIPHTFANTTDETVRMLSFELIPIR